ncbi:MAG: lipoyl synthase [Deltaproteobacteria bacterium RIFOXYA12_FULL_61_11]|nr:MAG: lipoyl synthase [Deltaproteobacteria bacterium RIFOXYA12_FULL_61_11]
MNQPGIPRSYKRTLIHTDLLAVKQVLRRHGLHTVCERAHCPNIVECMRRPTATFLLLGPVCTRGCGYCQVAHGTPRPPDPNEPEAVAAAVAELSLRYAVLTSVTRDDLEDGGLAHFCSTVRAIKHRTPEVPIEVLTPDFQGHWPELERLLSLDLAVFNHNLETVEDLFPAVRPAARYLRSLALLAAVKESRPGQRTKSGLMVGLGESREQLRRTFGELAAVGCDVLTVGQYFPPSRRHVKVLAVYEDEDFAELTSMATTAGIPVCHAGRYVRSSYHADADGEVHMAGTAPTNPVPHEPS